MKQIGVLVKICGITNTEDARWAANLGADYVGLNFVRESSRKISVEKAKEILDELPSFVKAVVVFTDPDLEVLRKILRTVKISIVQFHGDESPELLRQLKSDFNIGIWKAIRVEDQNSLNKIQEFVGIADAILLDTFRENQVGGTGESFDWNLAVEAKKFGIPIFLAGGLTPENVVEAVEKVVPLGVDVASGVEKQDHPRRKDLEKMKQFIGKAKGMIH